MKTYEAIVVGSGPNGLSAAIALAQAGVSVLVLEAKHTPGGGTRTESLTLPGFNHDVCSAIHPLAAASPFWRTLPLEKYGLEWVHSEAALAHPLDTEAAVLLHTSVEATARGLGKDGEAYYDLMQPLTLHWEEIFEACLQPLWRRPRHLWTLASFGFKGLASAQSFARRNFHTPQARALFAGIAAHANTPLDHIGTAALGLMLNLAAHARGWPFPKGGAHKIHEALIAYFLSLGGSLQLDREVRTIKDLPESRWVFLDLTPRQILSILTESLSTVEMRRWSDFRYGPGAFKMDWALAAPIPWKSALCAKAATVHLGGSFEDIVMSEKEPIRGRISEKPLVILSQPSLFDSTRAPQNQHTAWAYCHVPHASTRNYVDLIENQIERFAPGFRNLVLARSMMAPQDLQRRNANIVGGDIAGGAFSLKRLLLGPSLNKNPYHLSIPGFFICSASTPPGPGVHGMCGYNAAQNVLREL